MRPRVQAAKPRGRLASPALLGLLVLAPGLLALSYPPPPFSPRPSPRSLPTTPGPLPLRCHQAARLGQRRLQINAQDARRQMRRAQAQQLRVDRQRHHDQGRDRLRLEALDHLLERELRRQVHERHPAAVEHRHPGADHLIHTIEQLARRAEEEGAVDLDDADAAFEVSVEAIVSAIAVSSVPDAALVVRFGASAAAATVTAKVASTIDAAALCKMAERGQIKGGILDGPLALDNAINVEAAAIKNIVSPVAGRADVLIVPDLEAGNMLAKQLLYFANADAAGLVLGARVPIILTSRSDSLRVRITSAALAKLVAAKRAAALGGKA